MSSKFVANAALWLWIALPVVADALPTESTAPLSVSAGPQQRIGSELQALIQQVWSKNPALQAVRARRDAAQARRNAASKPLHNPTLELDTEQAGTDTTSLGLTQTIDWSDKQGALEAIATHQLHLAEAELRLQRQRLAAETLEALVRYSIARERYALSLRRSQLMKRFRKTVEQRRAAGDIGAADVMLARVAYSEALIALASSESELAGAEATLCGVTGLNREHWPELPEILVKPPLQADRKLLDRHPELVARRARLEMAKARITLAERQRQLDPTVGIRVGREDGDPLLGLTLELPLFVRNSYREELRAAAHVATSEEQAYRNVWQRAVARLDGALARYRNTSQAWEVWIGTGKQALREQMELLEQMWRAQELSATDFLIQAKQNIDTQATATGLKQEVWRSAIAWQTASGQIEVWLDLNESENQTDAGGAMQ